MTNDSNELDIAYRDMVAARDEAASPVETYRRSTVVATGGQGTPTSPATTLSVFGETPATPDVTGTPTGQPDPFLDPSNIRSDEEVAAFLAQDAQQSAPPDPLGHTAALVGRGVVEGARQAGEALAVPGHAVRGLIAEKLNQVFGTDLTGETLGERVGEALSAGDPFVSSAGGLELLTNIVTDPLSYLGLGAGAKAGEVVSGLTKAFEKVPEFAGKAEALAKSFAPEIKRMLADEKGAAQSLPHNLTMSEKGFIQKDGVTLTHAEIDQLGTDIVNQTLAEQPAIVQQAMDEAGFASKQVLQLITRATIGAGVGAATGDPENAIRNALIGAGLGVLATPELLQKFTLITGKSRAAQKAAEAITPSPSRPGELRLSNPKLTPDTQSSGFKQLNISELRVNDLAHPDAVNPKKVQELRGSLRAGKNKTTAPIEVTQNPDGTYTVTDGRHRVQAALDEGFTTITANVAAPPLTPSSLSSRYQQLVDEAKRGIRHDPVVKAEGDALVRMGHISQDTIKSLNPGTVMTDAELYATETVVMESGRNVLEKLALVPKGAKADSSEVRAAIDALNTHGYALDPKRKALQSETARALRILGTEAPADVLATQKFNDQFGPLMERIADGSVDPLHLIKLARRLKTPEQMAVYTAQLQRPTLTKAYINLWVNQMLSSPHTLVANAIGNAASLTTAIADRQVASLFGEAVRPGEAGAMVYGVLESFMDGVRAAGHVMKTGVAAGGKIESPYRATFVETGKLGTLGHALDYVGAYYEMVGGRALLATDQFYRAIATNGEIRAQALREAFDVVNAGSLTGKAARNEVTRLKNQYFKNPTPAMLKAGDEFGAYITFTNELGPTGKWLQEGTAKLPLLKIVAPFVKAPLNILGQATQHTPLGLFAKSFWDAQARGGADAQLALAKVSFGSMIMAGASTWAANGIITGSGPGSRNSTVRKDMVANGWAPFSINVSAAIRAGSGESTAWQKGDELISFQNIEPIGTLLAGAAQYVSIVSNSEPDASMADLAVALALGATKIAEDKTFFTGVARLTNAISMAPTDGGESLKRYLVKEAVSLTPIAGAGQTNAVTKVIDPVIRDVQTLMEAYISRTPGMSTTLRPVLDHLGNETFREGGLGPDLVSPLYLSTYKQNHVFREITRNATNVGDQSKSMFGLKLSTDEQYDLQLLTTRKAKIGGMTLEESLNHLFTTYSYKAGTEGPDGRRSLLIKERFQAFRKKGEVMMLKNPDIKARVRAIQQTHANLMKSQPMPSDAEIDASASDLTIGGQ